MKKQRKYQRILSIVLITVLMLNFFHPSYIPEIKTRTIDVESIKIPNKFTNVFKSCNIKHGDDTTKKIILNATSDYNSENILFNNVSLDNI